MQLKAGASPDERFFFVLSFFNKNKNLKNTGASLLSLFYIIPNLNTSSTFFNLLIPNIIHKFSLV